MEKVPVCGITLYYDAAERETAEVIRDACERSTRLIREHWGLDTPKECRVYVMTSWLQFIFHSAPWTWRILLGAFFPLWCWRVMRVWKFSAGWTQHYGKRVAVGVKPPRLVAAANKDIGQRIFTGEWDRIQKTQLITCHELVHAFTGHLRLPPWLHEGLAMTTVDRFVGEPTIRRNTIETLAQASLHTRPKGYRSLSPGDTNTFVYLFVRGYWIVRYLENTQPELLRTLLAERHSRRALEDKLASALGMTREEFWESIDQEVAAHFKSKR